MVMRSASSGDCDAGENMAGHWVPPGGEIGSFFGSVMACENPGPQYSVNHEPGNI
jgi:hypothetical protein